LEREVFERVLSLYPPRHKEDIIFNDEERYTQAQCAAHGTLNDEEKAKWGNILETARQGRGLDVKGFGHAERFEDIRELVWRYAHENLDMAIQDSAVSRLGGRPGFLPNE
jgi:hypothetical protein